MQARSPQGVKAPWGQHQVTPCTVPCALLWEKDMPASPVSCHFQPSSWHMGVPRFTVWFTSSSGVENHLAQPPWEPCPPPQSSP